MSLINLGNLPLAAVIAVFLASAGVIALAGTRMTRLADRLADLTGMGEALFGAVLLGGVTSLPGILASVVAALEGYPQLAVSNAVGGIAAQITFLAVADIFYRKANLEHAAASVENLVQAALLGALLSIPLLAMSAPDFHVWGVNPASVLLIGAYVFGIRLVAQARSGAYWQPRHTAETTLDEPDEPAPGATRSALWRVWGAFALYGGIVAVAGYTVAESGIALSQRTGLSETVVGGLFTAIATSLPELVTSIAAVRRGALTLAVGGIIGGNSFDVLFVAFSDVAYRPGSIYHAINEQQIFVIALSLLLNGILLLGLLRRERRGIANIGFESFLVLLLYAGGFALISLSQA
ncbi:MAG: cation transporter [Salinisphaeraceae bacterium]|jgi:cation:H+ antiporter|nr:cation transporter [Salinisphaeraceae bacterium]